MYKKESLMEKFETKIIARYAETDQMGVVHHSVYPIWYEVARTEFAKKYILPYSQAEKIGIMMPVAELTSKYYKSAHFGEDLVIETSVEELGKAYVVMKQNIMRNDELLVEVKTKIVFVGVQIKSESDGCPLGNGVVVGKPQRIPDFWKSKLEQLQK